MGLFCLSKVQNPNYFHITIKHSACHHKKKEKATADSFALNKSPTLQCRNKDNRVSNPEVTPESVNMIESSFHLGTSWVKKAIPGDEFEGFLENLLNKWL